MDISYIKELIYKQIVGMLSEKEQKQLDEWKSANANNEKLLAELTSAHFIIKALQAPTTRAEAEGSWKQIKKRCTPHREIFPYILWASAACFLLLIGFSTFWFLKHNNTSTPITLSAGTEKAIISLATGKTLIQDDHIHTQFYTLQKEEKHKLTTLSPDLCHTIKVPRGGEYTLILEDGTTIHLNSESSLSIPADFSAQNRSVNLSGEAYFQVKADPMHPFIVQTDKSEIKVTGTCFNVKNYPEDSSMLVTLEKGEIQINSAYHQMALKAGEQAAIDQMGNIKEEETDTYQACAWHHNRIVYENQSLVHILEDLGRWYNFEASFTNDSLRELRFSMDIDKTTDFNKVAEMMERMNKIRIKIERNNKCIITN